MLDPTVLLVDATDVPAEDHHELVGWGYKKGKSMRIMAISTSNKILLAHMRVNPLFLSHHGKIALPFACEEQNRVHSSFLFVIILK
ncbi:transposase [Pasteuria penetrans]|uniref:transposase n=1 Tax=Pasteuria penetrans TaxID=86005 RepID=UPI000FA74336|nr:transposase [Pasteuria penetrans]